MYIARCRFRASNGPHEFRVKFDWLTHKITSQLTGIKATKGQQGTRKVNVSGVLFSSSPLQKNNKKICLFSFSNIPFGFHAFNHLSSSQKLRIFQYDF